MNTMRQQLQDELLHHIVPFWARQKDELHGGFYGTVNYDLQVDQTAGKGGIVAARFLWSFAAIHRVTDNEQCLDLAHHAYEFISTKLVDQEAKGVYWMLDAEGQALDTRKHIYAQCFVIYSLSEYVRITNNPEALQLALSLYELIETKGYDPVHNAYKEEFNRQWVEIPNEMLSENGVIADVTMNTHLHILEAYTNLYRVHPDPQLRARLVNLIELFYNQIYDKETHFNRIFFNSRWESLIDLQSFGHDIEASWLIDDAMKVIGLEDPMYLQMVTDIAYNIAECAIEPDGSLMNERDKGVNDPTRVWWVQAEAMVGFYNAYERTQDPHFLELVKGLWHYTKAYMIDKRPGGEWYWSVEPDGTPTVRDISNSWKALYHNSRFCLELMERMNEDDTSRL